MKIGLVPTLVTAAATGPPLVFCFLVAPPLFISSLKRFFSAFCKARCACSVMEDWSSSKSLAMKFEYSDALDNKKSS